MAHDVRSLGRGLVFFADAAFGLAAAVAVVLFYARPTTFGVYDEVQGEVRVSARDHAGLELVVVGAALLLVLNLLYFLYGRRPKEPLRYVASHASGGVVRVAREALETGLRNAGEALDEVTRLRVSVESGGLKRIVVRAFFQAPDGVALQDTSRRLRAALATRYAEMVRPAEGMRTDFEIEFVGFSGKLPPRPKTPPAEEERAPFTGPQYPIDDDPLGQTDGT